MQTETWCAYTGVSDLQPGSRLAACVRAMYGQPSPHLYDGGWLKGTGGLLFVTDFCNRDNSANEVSVVCAPYLYAIFAK
jgi:hypothetical protein